MPSPSKIPLGQLLIERRAITSQQLEQALQKQKESGGLLGSILLEMGFISEQALFMPVLAGQMNVEYVNLKESSISPEIIRRIPPKIAAHYRVIPVALSGEELVVASDRPQDIELMDELATVTAEPVRLALAGGKDIDEAIRKYYGIGAETIESMMGTVERAPETETIDLIDEKNEEASISRFLNQILLQAYRDRASDVHIEPVADDLKIRYRVDGVLYDARVPGNIKHFKDAINSRIKILSRLNIAEKRRPQDGRFKVRVEDLDLDLRVSFLPTPSGESVVLRILQTTRLYKLRELGIPDKEFKILDRLIRKPNGIIFLTGPTGSGKTTTLYSCLSEINTEQNKIITIEDPVEYQIPGIIQIQVNPQIGLTFANGLRSMLRHDPDIMMVGEVRDHETAEIAIQVALTGHLVFSTLHTNDAAGGVTRLIDMGVEPYLVSSTVQCFIAQRLLRNICPHCKQPSEDAQNFHADVVVEWMKLSGDTAKPVMCQGKGCDRCHGTGYQGREAIYEFLQMTPEIRELIMQKAQAETIARKAVEQGMIPLAQAGWLKVKQGLTTLEEVIRVTRQET